MFFADGWSITCLYLRREECKTCCNRLTAIDLFCIGPAGLFLALVMRLHSQSRLECIVAGTALPRFLRPGDRIHDLLESIAHGALRFLSAID